MNLQHIQKLLPFIFLFFCFSIKAQTHEISEHPSEKKHSSEEEHTSLKRHNFGFVVSHTHINSAKENPDGSKFIAAPSFCLNYNFNFNHKWAIGLHNDIILENIDLEHTHEGGAGIKRERPISSAIMAMYKPIEHLAILAGGGMEFSNHEDFAVIRFGIETPIHLENNWEIFATLTADIGINNYDSLTFGFGIAKSL